MNDSQRAKVKTKSSVKLNFWIDMLTGVTFSAMLGTGILLKWILPPGSRGGSGLVWFGEGRHFWGDVHFYIAIAMLTLLIVHVWLHFDWVVSVWRKLLGSMKSLLTWVIILLFSTIIRLPLIVKSQYSAQYEEDHDKLEQESNQQKQTENP